MKWPWFSRDKSTQVVPQQSKALVPPRGAWTTAIFGSVLESFSGAWQRSIIKDSSTEILSYAAVYACVSLISKDIGKLRLRLMQRKPGNWWDEITDPKSPIFLYPNRYQTLNQFFEQWLVSKLVYGNTYVLKQRDAQRRVEALYILDPRGVVPLVADDGSVFYQCAMDHLVGLDRLEPAIPAEEIIHDRNTPLWHPLVGVGPLYASAAAASQGNRIQTNSSVFFENLSRPSGQLTAPGHIDDETAKRLKAHFEENFSGSNVGRLLVSGDGLEYKPIAIPAQQAQLSEQQKWTVEDVCRAFLVPLYKIGAGPMPSISNVAALNLEYYQQALQPHIENIESLLDTGLELGRGLGCEFDLDALMRMDPKTRAETREIEIRSATITPNEARRHENREPKEGGDELYMQQQNYSLPALAKRDASDDPFGTGKTAAPPAPTPSAPPAAANDDEGAEEVAELMAHIVKGLGE